MMESSSSSTPQSSSSPQFDIETVRLQLSMVVARIKSKVSVESLRPLPVFLGLRDSPEGDGLQMSLSSYSAPKTATSVSSRIKANCDYFLSNYVLVATMVAMVVSIMKIEMLFAIAIVYGLWMLHGYLIQHSVVVGGIQIHALLTVQQRFYLVFAISVVAIMWECLVPALTMVAVSTLLILSHAVLRTPTVEDAPSANNSEASPLMAKV